MTFVSSYRRGREIRKYEGSRDRNSTLVILKPRVLYDLNRQLVKIKNSKFFLVRESQKKLKTALCGAIQNDSFQSHHKNKSLGLRLL